MSWVIRILLGFHVASSVVLAIPQAASSAGSSTATSPAASTGAPSITVSTAVPAPTLPLTSTIPSQAPLPPNQPWCPSKIFCAGDILQTVNIANLYTDQKTFVDKPTNSSSASVLAAFNALVASAPGNTTANLTEQQVASFVTTNFRGEGLELEAQALPSFNANPPFLTNVSDSLMRAFAQTVHGYWTQLIRGTNASTLCGEGTNGGSCESTLIPLNHTFVVPGGRFREQYYWDSFWIVQGLLQSGLGGVANDTLQNFMDEIEHIGFVPNGGRIYYLDRSQPPLFIHMLSAYVNATQDTSILSRALPLAERELQWWSTNRSTTVKSPFTNTTHSLFGYSVNNSAPRPESYLQDYLTANGPDITTPLTEPEKEALYGELATGAETGWDYTVRWAAQPFAGGTNDTNPVLRTLNIKNLVPLCLNSILYKSRLLLADLYSPPFSSAKNTSNAQRASFHRSQAANIRAGILDLMWDPTKLAFYDFNKSSNARSTVFTAAHFYPLWSGIIPPDVLGDQNKTFGMFAAVNMVMNRYNGTFPTSFIESGLQWDAPNAWPPHQYILLEALRAIPSNLSTMPVPATGGPGVADTFELIPPGQIGIGEDQLPGQSLGGGKGNSTGDLNTLNGTVANGGNATAGEGWAQTLQREVANRYFASAFCSWHATGGSIPGVLPRLSDQELNVTQSTTNTGNMFEKFSVSDIDSAGRGGEYTVQAGFGWTNGVLLWVASNFGKVIVAPNCPPLLAVASSSGSGSAASPSATGKSGAVEAWTISRFSVAVAVALAVVMQNIM